MTGRYILRKLPQGSIIEFPKGRKGRIPNARIEEYDVFPDICRYLPVRPNAARFARYRDVYVELYEEGSFTKCLFFFTLSDIRGNTVLDICRCAGSRTVKKHWNTVISFINDCKDKIRKLSYEESLDFYFFRTPRE